MRPTTVSTFPFTFELAAFEALGLDADRILGLAELSREAIADPHARLPIEAVHRLWDAAVRVSGDPAIGLRVGAKMYLGALGSFEYLLRNSETLRQSLERATEFMRLIDDAGVVALHEEKDRAAMRAGRSDGYPNVAGEIDCLFSGWKSVLETEWPSGRILAVNFSHPCPTRRDAYVRHFGCEVRFDTAHNEMWFPAELLALRPRNADPGLGRVLEDHARHLLATLPEADPLVQTARAKLLEQLTQGSPSLAALARALHMSERTLRRRLEEGGTSYQALLEDLRERLARHYVERTRDGFDAIADRLAFADASTFFRAFKRWTGTTPARYRDRKLPGA